MEGGALGNQKVVTKQFERLGQIEDAGIDEEGFIDIFSASSEEEQIICYTNLDS